MTVGAVWVADILYVNGDTGFMPCASRDDAVAWLCKESGVDLESAPERELGTTEGGYWKFPHDPNDPDQTVWSRSGCDFLTVELVPLYRAPQPEEET